MPAHQSKKKNKEVPAEALAMTNAPAGSRLAELQERWLEQELDKKEAILEEEQKRHEKRVAAARANHERVNAERRMCRHRRQDQTFCVNGQVNSDGRACAQCQRCQIRWYDTPHPNTNEKPIPPEIRAYLESSQTFGSALGGSTPAPPRQAAPVVASGG